MENIVLALVVIAVWLTAVISIYYVMIKKWLPYFDDLTPHERAKLFETRRQRYLHMKPPKSK